MKILIGATAFWAGVAGAQAEPLKPLAAKQVSLSSVQSVSYYTQEPDGFRVVTTFVDGEAGRPIRVVATLLDGQSLKLSVAHGVGEAEETLELARQGEIIVVRDPSDTLTASVR